MEEHLRAYAWIHFATSAKHATSEQQQAAQADAMLVEFDKRKFGVNPAESSELASLGAAISKLEEELAAARAQCAEDAADITRLNKLLAEPPA